MRTTATSAKGPEMTSCGRAIALAQWRAADSQSWLSMQACSDCREDLGYRSRQYYTQEEQKNDIRTLSSITCPTRSPASRTRPISSSSERTLLPTRSAVFAVADTRFVRSCASVCKSSSCGRSDCRRFSDAIMGSLACRSLASESESSDSSDWNADRHDRISGRLVSALGSLRTFCGIVVLVDCSSSAIMECSSVE
jgi:hypothetical protein